MVVTLWMALPSLRSRTRKYTSSQPASGGAGGPAGKVFQPPSASSS
jgi:hypothetical protein